MTLKDLFPLRVLCRAEQKPLESWPLTGLRGSVDPKLCEGLYARPNTDVQALCKARCTNGQIGRFTVHVPGRNRTEATVTCEDAFGIARFEIGKISLNELDR